MNKITIEGAVLKNGNIPVPEGVLGDNINSIPNTVIVTSNSLFSIPIKTDNTSEYGPENIFYKTVAPSGTYKVEVDYFLGVPLVTNYNIVVKKEITLLPTKAH